MKGKIAEAGGIEAMVGAMLSNVQSRDVQELGCRL